jgi:hypothetical protein
MSHNDLSGFAVPELPANPPTEEDYQQILWNAEEKTEEYRALPVEELISRANNYLVVMTYFTENLLERTLSYFERV